MTEEEALKTCDGFVAYPELKGYFPFEAANFLVGTGKYVFHTVAVWGYVLRRLTPEAKERLRAQREREKYGGALDWLDR